MIGASIIPPCDEEVHYSDVIRSHWPLWESPVAGEFPAQKASNAENDSI